MTVTCNAALTTDCSAGQVFNNYRLPLVGNKLPLSYIDPVSAKILNKYVPLPQGPNAALLTNNYLNPVRATRFTRLAGSEDRPERRIQSAGFFFLQPE